MTSGDPQATMPLAGLRVIEASTVLAGHGGIKDFALACDMASTGETLLHPKQQMLIAAKSAGLIPLGFVDSVAGIGDWEAFRRTVQHSRHFGSMGAHCIHPRQVSILNEESESITWHVWKPFWILRCRLVAAQPER